MFTYPVIQRAPRPAAAAAINVAVREFLLRSVGEPRRHKSIDAAMAAFIQEYQDLKQQPGAPGSFWEERTVTILYQSAAIASLKFDVSFFFGGAHPNYAATFTSFNLMTGARVTLADVLVAGYERPLAQIGEREFRISHGIKPGTSLRDAGYTFFKNDTFALNDNFWLGPTGVTFYYNTYEIAPYSMGVTELLLPYPQIRELIKPGGLVGPMR